MSEFDENMRRFETSPGRQLASDQEAIPKVSRYIQM
jgi:hypothetical protein